MHHHHNANIENIEPLRLIPEWNTAQANGPGEHCIHQLFEKQVECTPEKPALSFEKEWLSYQELNVQANRLARHLRTLGVGPETLVGICMERSVNMVVALLAVLKAGGAYLPLDPAYPVERLAFMLHDSQAAILLSTERLSGIFTNQEGVKIVLVDAERDTFESHSIANLLCDVQLHNLAYVIYTSGSTGRPKGVLITHRSLVNHAVAFSTHFSLQSDDRALQFFSISFDAAAEEIFPTLISGATIVLRHEPVPNPLELYHFLLEERITILNLPTAYWHLWVSQLAAQCAPTPYPLRLVIVGGEKVSSKSFITWQKWIGNNIRWANTYGPTETTITATIYEPDSLNGEYCNEVSMPIGQPIANTQVYVLDTSLQLVSVGTVGELYISGTGLARGYLNRPELTQERFVPCPFDSEPHARMYRTGDLVRYLPNGQLEFVGRVDQQVKIRGFRIELGEIEAVLCLHPAIKETIVLAREDHDDDKHLVAYIVHNQASSSTSPRELCTYLQQRIPDYMLPSAFVYMNSFPLTLNGKIDRNAFPKPDQYLFSDIELYVAPRTPTEQKLALMWTEILKCERVGIHDSFFDVGGHSLLATLLTSRIRENFQVEISLHKLFNTPTIAGLAEQIESLRQESCPIVLPKPIHSLVQKDHILLSFGQQRLWIEEQLLAGSCTYTIPLALHLSGPLHPMALEHALHQVVLRHESLRTHFVERGGPPVPVIDAVPNSILTHVDLSMVSSHARESAWQQFVQHPFDLSQGPLFRATLFHVQKHESLLLLCMHHIISDGWSMNILLQEIATFYQAAIKVSALPFPPPPPIQYTDFARWQHNWLQGEVLQQQLRYWRDQLHGAPPLLALPLDHPRLNRPTSAGASVPFTLSTERTNALRRLAQQEGVSLFMVLLAAFQLLLARYSGQDDIVVGTPIANRTRREVEEVVGFFVNTLVLRTDLSGNPSIQALLARVREVCLGAYAHQDLPFERVVEELQPERNPSYSPLIQVLFVLQNTPLDMPSFSEVQVCLQEIETPTSKFDLTLELTEEGEQIHGRIEYKTALFERETIERMAGHWQMMLEGITTRERTQPVSTIPLLTAAEREQMLSNWNGTQAEYPQGRGIHHLFEEQVERTPEAIALVCGEEHLSYRVLNQRANRMAHYLQGQGVGRDQLVGICLARSVEMVVAILAVLKAGGAYVPLDPAYPSERLAFILQDSQALLTLTTQQVQGVLGSGSDNVVCLDTQREQVAQFSQENPLSGGTEHDLAYVIYTSGSTGKPKGVLIEHRSSALLLYWAHETFSPKELAGVLASTSICFDLSIFELFAPLSCGGRIILVNNVLDVHIAPDTYGITLINTVPSAITELVKLEAIPNTVLTVNLAGEALQAHLVQKLYQCSQVQKVFNLYGPSEDTTYSTAALIACNAIGTPPIGRPLPNTQLYILNSHAQLVPQGVIGELYIGGASLARGYLNRSELTQERFVPCPFSAEPHARMYRTGDLVRYLPNGQLEFIGRVDQQVKIRGFRIELGEIEATLRQYHAIKDAIVLAREEPYGGKQLVAYCIGTDSDSILSSGDLRTHLRKQLPEYMLPVTYILLDSFPLTPNGKVDRQRLPAPSWSNREAPQTYLAPRDRLEFQLVRTWEDVLGKKPIGVRDNFFDLGGHSLQAVQLMASLQQLLGRSFPLSSLLQGDGTIEYLASILRGQMELEPWSPLVTIQEGKGKYPFFAIHPSSGEVIRYVDLARLLGKDQPFYGVQAPGLYEQHDTLMTIEAMAERYIEAIRTVQPCGPYFLGGFSLGGNIAFEMAQQLYEKGEKVAFLLLLDSANPHENWSLVQEDAAYWCWQHESYLPSLSLEYLRSLQPEKQLDYLAGQLRHNSGVPPRFTLTNSKQFLQVQKNNVQALTRYVARTYPGKLTLFRVTEQPEEYLHDLELGWTGLAAQGIDVYECLGKHETILTQPILETVAKQIKECLLASQKECE